MWIRTETGIIPLGDARIIPYAPSNLHAAYGLRIGAWELDFGSKVERDAALDRIHEWLDTGGMIKSPQRIPNTFRPGQYVEYEGFERHLVLDLRKQKEDDNDTGTV